MYWTYILRLNNGSYYVGSTSDIKVRFEHHSLGRVKSTKNYLPVALIYTEESRDRGSAQSREYQIKKWKSRAAIERLIKKT